MKKTTKELIEALSSGPVKRYISEHQHRDVREVILKHKEILGIPTARLFDQIAIRKKAKEKLPAYYQNTDVIYPPSQNFEQSSSETTAAFKAEILADRVSGLNPHPVGADLSGGFGVDTWSFSRCFHKIHYVERDPGLLEIARHNHRVLNATNIEYHATSAEEFLLQSTSQPDFVFVDPSRRTEKKERVHKLEDSEPDIVKLFPAIFSKTTILLVKTSPLLDIQAAISRIPFVSRVYVVSVKNECKELLLLSEKGFDGIPAIEAVDFQDSFMRSRFNFTIPEEQKQTILSGDPGAYLYEPNAAILKAGAFKTVGARFNLRKIQVNTHLYTGDDFIETFPGRKFAIEAVVKSDATIIRKYFPGGQANVTTRNYPLSPDALRKKLKLKDGGEKFLIGFSGQNKKFLVVASKV